jgi:hypothetical protein
MNSIDNTHLGRGITGILHLFTGLMKSDGHISEAEREKVKILCYKFEKRLPGSYETYRDLSVEIVDDPELKVWTPEQHMQKGFALFDQYLQEGPPHHDHLDAILEIMEILSEIDETNDQEALYIGTVRAHFEALKVRA